MTIMTIMTRKLVACIVTLLLLTSVTAFAAPADSANMTILNQAVMLETVFYGNEQTGSLVERVAALEHDYYGKETEGSLIERLDRLYTNVEVNSAATPAFVTRLGAVEWKLTHTVCPNQNAKVRMENLERVMSGSIATGCFRDRLAALQKLAFTEGQINVAGTTVSKDTLVKIKTLTAWGSKNNHVNEIVSYQAVDDVYSGDVLVIAKGAVGTGKVVKVEPAKNFGRDAELQISFNTVQGFDNTVLDVYQGDKAKKETRSLMTAAGASVAGMVLLGPIGIVGGAFVHGKEVSIPAGTEMYVQLKSDAEVLGLQTKPES